MSDEPKRHILSVPTPEAADLLIRELQAARAQFSGFEVDVAIAGCETRNKAGKE